MTIKTDYDKMRTTLIWAIGVMISLMVLLVGAVARGEVRTNQLEEKQDKMEKDYLPYFAFQYIVESNNKLMSLYSAIDVKDDIRYNELMKQWNDLQQEVIKQAGQNKRSGHQIGGQ